LAHIARRQRQLLGKLQHGVFGVAQRHLAPIIFHLLRCEIVAAFLTQKLCVGDGSEAAVQRRRCHRGDHLALRRG
jgi:hypothetical protein